MTEAFARERQVAIEAVRHASHVCRAVQQELAGAVLEKKDRSPVTVADFGSQALICRALRSAFPDDPVVAEESGDQLREADNAPILQKVVSQVSAVQPGADVDEILGWIDHGGGAPAPRFWTLDPIDGTKGFLRGQQYAIALGLIIDGKVAVAALGCPNLPVDPANPDGPLGVVYSAVAGGGCEIAPMDGGDMQPCKVADTSDPADARTVESVESGHSSHDLSARVATEAGITNDPVRIDSQAKYAVVARGEATVYWRFSRGDYREKIWDHAAGYLVCVEAGGRVTDLEGKDLDFSLGRKLESNRGVLVSNGKIHDRVLQAIEKIEAEG